MNCETFFDRYLLLDKHEPLPAGLRLHLLCCASCRQVVSRMAAAENLQRRMVRTPLAADERILSATMNAVSLLNKKTAPAAVRQEKDTTLVRWLAVGTFLILGFILLPLSGIGKIGVSPFDDAFWIPFALLCAGAVIAYSAIFLAKNLVFFTDKFAPQGEGDVLTGKNFSLQDI